MLPTDPTQNPLANEPAPTDPSGQPVINSDRQALINKYEAAYLEPTSTEPTPATAVATDSVQPVSTEPATAIDSNAILQSLVAEIAALKGQLAPAQPAAVALPEEDWLALLASGKKEEGEQALLKKLAPSIQEAAVRQAIERIDVQRTLDSFATQIRQENADLLPMESYIATAAQYRIQAAQNAGLVKTPADYVKVYKESVTAEIENARKLAQTLRGAGKTDATTRIQQVTAQQTIKSNPVNTQREAPAAPTEPQVETTSDYFAKRKEQHSRFSGLSTTA